MADIQLIDVMVHVDEPMSIGRRETLEAHLREQEGVVSVHGSDKTPHLFIVTYDPDHTRSEDILRTVTREQLHAELVGM